jgi:hypothetical protein
LTSQDWANPLVRKHFRLYPEVDPSVPISEMWQAAKWVSEVPDDELSPMWYDENNPHKKHFYVKEITQTVDGNYIFPTRWVTKKGVVYARLYQLLYSNEVSQ